MTGRVLSEEEIREIEDEWFPDFSQSMSIPNLIATIRDRDKTIAELQKRVTAPDGFEVDISFYCSKCGEESENCESCGKVICPDCSAKWGGNEYFCKSCWEAEEAELDTLASIRKETTT